VTKKTPLLNEAACHCGDIRLKLREPPKEIFECNCSICRRLGVLWAYYHCDEVSIETANGSTSAYVWNNKALEFHSCTRCGCATHWIATDRSFRDRMGINARLIDGLSPRNTKVGYVDHGDMGWYWIRDTDR